MGLCKCFNNNFVNKTLSVLKRLLSTRNTQFGDVQILHNGNIVNSLDLNPYTLPWKS